LGIAVGSYTEGSVLSQVRKALDQGIAPDEIRHAILLAGTSIGFPRMMAAMKWADDIINKIRK
ncbi:MAG TPA: carboxymuconolactone decarboxylase family protein, partial [Acidobacteriota bacterium]|nr:carboxymuconolactone decarboxylase family protein [Acidobacteriota bacterium]